MVKNPKLSWPRRIFISILSTLLFLIIVIGVPLAATGQVLTSRTSVKNIIDAPEVYNGLKQAVADFKIKPDNPSQAKQAQANADLLKAVIDKYVSRDFYHRLIGGVIDGTYDWLEGKASKPKFAVVITTNKAGFKNFLADLIMAKYQGLPICKAGGKVATDPLKATCRVPIKTATLRTKIISQLKGPSFDELFNQATISSDNLIKPLDRQATRNARLVFGLLNKAALGILAAILLIGGLLFRLGGGKQQGWRVVAWAILVPSLIVLLGSLAWYAFTARFMALISQHLQLNQIEALRPVVLDLIRRLASSINNWRSFYSGGLVAVGVASLIIHKRLQGKLRRDPTAHLSPFEIKE